MSFGDWIRTRRGATITAVVLVLVIRMAINGSGLFGPGFLDSRTWVLFTVPFHLVQHTQLFWLEAIAMLGAAVLVLSLTREHSIRAILPVCISLIAIDVLVVLAGGAIAVVGVNHIIASEALPTPPQTWDLLLVDMVSVLMGNAFSLTIALAGTWVFLRVRPRAALDDRVLDSTG